MTSLIKQKDGSAYTGAVGQEGIIDLTSVGLGKVSFISTDAAGTIANIGTDLATALNGKAVTAGAAGAGNGLKLQIGDTGDAFNQLEVVIADMHAAALGIGGIDLSNQPSATAAIDTIKTAINTVSSTRGKLGAAQNRLEHTINNLGVTTENITAAESRIRDVDMAKEMMEFT